MNIFEAFIRVVESTGLVFSFKGKNVLPSDFLKEDFLMPAFAKRADDLCSLCFSYGLGASFEDKKDSTLGFIVKFDRSCSNVIRLVFLSDVFWDIARATPSSGVVVLDELLYD